MRKVRIDFAPPGLVRAMLRAPRGAWAVAMPAAIIVLELSWFWHGYRRDVDKLEQLRAQVRVQATSRAGAPAPVAARANVPEAQATAVNAAVMQLNLPWRALHDAVQAATPAGIALLALEPDAKKTSVRITAEAKSSDDMIAYVEQLQKGEWFRAVALTRHEINEQDPNRPIRFQLDAAWKGTP